MKFSQLTDLQASVEARLQWLYGQSPQDTDGRVDETGDEAQIPEKENVISFAHDISPGNPQWLVLLQKFHHPPLWRHPSQFCM